MIMSMMMRAIIRYTPEELRMKSAKCPTHGIRKMTLPMTFSAGMGPGSGEALPSPFVT